MWPGKRIFYSQDEVDVTTQYEFDDYDIRIE